MSLIAAEVAAGDLLSAERRCPERNRVGIGRWLPEAVRMTNTTTTSPARVRDTTPFRAANEGPDTASAGTLTDQLSTRLLNHRIIVLGQEVDDAIAQRICAELLLCSAEDPHRDISLHINSPGGSVSAGFAIYDTMRLIPNDVSTVAMGLAASMGQFLLTAGTPGKRYALPHAEVLLHQGSAGLGGSAMDIEIQADRLQRMRETMMGITAEHTGQSVERVTQDAARDRWFTAAQARDYGFLDHILTDLGPAMPTVRPGRFGLGQEG